MSVPTFGISAGGVDITPRIAGGSITMTVTDGVGLKSDTVTIEIDNMDAVVAAPRTGQVITAWGGYRGGIIRTFGDYTVDQVQFSGFPRKITVSGQAVAAKSMAKRRMPKDYRKEEYPTYQKIFDEVAGRAGLSLRIDGAIGSIAVEYEAQGEEDQLEFLTRLGRKLDAAVTVKGNMLVVARRGSGLSVSGGGMSMVSAVYGVNLIDYSSTFQDKPKHKEVEATWYDRKKNKREVVKEPAGSEGPPYLIRDPFQSEKEAKQAAKAQAKELKRAEGNASFDIDGFPPASGGSRVTASGCDPMTDRLWIAKTVTHKFSGSSAYTTTLECELPT